MAERPLDAGLGHEGGDELLVLMHLLAPHPTQLQREHRLDAVAQHRQLHVLGGLAGGEGLAAAQQGRPRLEELVGGRLEEDGRLLVHDGGVDVAALPRRLLDANARLNEVEDGLDVERHLLVAVLVLVRLALQRLRHRQRLALVQLRLVAAADGQLGEVLMCWRWWGRGSCGGGGGGGVVVVVVVGRRRR